MSVDYQHDERYFWLICFCYTYVLTWSNLFAKTEVNRSKLFFTVLFLNNVVHVVFQIYFEI